MKSYRIKPNHQTHMEDNEATITSFQHPDLSIVNVKKWGCEDVIHTDSPYTVKIMTLHPNAQCSMHFHREKTETFIVLEGQLAIDLIDLRDGTTHNILLENKYDSITLAPDVPHSFYCPRGQTCDTIFLECSTKDNSSDNYRFFPSTSPEDNNPR